MFPSCYQPFRGVVRQLSAIPEQLGPDLQRTAMQLRQSFGDQLTQSQRVRFDTQGIRLLAKKRLEKHQVLAVTQECRQFPEPRAYYHGASRRQIGEEPGLIGCVLHPAPPRVIQRRC